MENVSAALDSLADFAGIHPVHFGHHRMMVPHFPFSVYYDIEGDDIIVKEVKGDTLQERLVPFMDAIKDPSKRKVVSVMINQQLYGEYTTSIANRFPLVGWKNGMKDVPLDTIPGIEKFASRDLTKTQYQLFDTGPMEFAIEVAPDESTVTVHAKSEYPLHADVSQPTATIGTCTVTQDFVIDLTGPEPAIKNLQIGQTLA